jgi:hypothetical protein
MEKTKELSTSPIASMPAKHDEFGRVTTAQQAELAGISVAASARAEVEAAYVLAIKNPRNEAQGRANILAVCKNLKFSETAIYRKPQGKKQVNGQWVANNIEGLSIRFAEECLRLWRNIKTLQTTIYDDPSKRIVKVTVIDLESNISYSKEFVIEKTVERKNAIGRDVVYERINSSGEKISVVVATEDEIMNKEAALASKTIRNNGLRLIPDFVLNEAMEIIRATVKAGVDQDPDKSKRDVVDNFAKLSISVKQLEDYLGHPIAELVSSEIVALKEVHNSIREGNSTWAEIMEMKNTETKTVEVVDKDAVAKELWGESSAPHTKVNEPLKGK